MKNTNYCQGSNETTSEKAINQEKIRMANVEENSNEKSDASYSKGSKGQLISLTSYLSNRNGVIWVRRNFNLYSLHQPL